MTENDILSYLEKAEAGTMYRYIREWESWWRGKSSAFHEYLENGLSGVPVKRELYRMNMAKKICEDWASLLLNDRTRVSVSDENSGLYVARVFSDTGFMRQANRLIEKAFAVGTGASLLRINGCVTEDGILTAGEDTSISFEFVDAAHIIPLSVTNGVITEAAFTSDGMSRGKRYTYIEIHTLEEDGYCVRNLVFENDGGALSERKLSDIMAGEGAKCVGVLHTGSKYPLFSIVTPNIVNHIDSSSALGVSVFADAVDCLKGVDLAFNNFCRDIKLGGKKVFINQSLVCRDDRGNIYTPDDVAQQLFVTVGDGDIAERQMITEHNPELRTSENADAVQCQLNYLSFRCGLGTHHYSFGETNDRAKLTATQYMGERQDMVQNVMKHQKNVEAFLVGVVRALLWCGRSLFGAEADPSASVSVEFDDSFFTDTDSQRERDMRELSAGIISAEEYRAKWGMARYEDI